MQLVTRGACPMTSVLELVSFSSAIGNVLRLILLEASFPRILEILNVNSFLLDYTDFWGRNDPDMLEVRDMNASQPTSLTHSRRLVTASLPRRNVPTLPCGRS
jgi:hypothetical protein